MSSILLAVDLSVCHESSYNYYYFVDIAKNIAEQIGGNNYNQRDYMPHVNQHNSFSFRPIHHYQLKKQLVL